MIVRRFFTYAEVARAAASFRHHPWLVSLIPAAVVALVSWSPVRGALLGLATLFVFRFVLGLYVLRLTRTP